jgi:hypothetical protein
MKKMNPYLQTSQQELTKLDSFHYLDVMLPELVSFVLVSVFLRPNTKSEFPKLFCVCKKWIELLDCPSVHKVIQLEMKGNDKWYRNLVTNNLRLFDKEIFPKVVFLNNLVSNFKPVGLLHSGSIVREIGRIDTANGTYCVTENGCCRFKNQADDVYLEPFDLHNAGPLYSPKGKSPVPLYIERRNPTALTGRFRTFFENVAFPGTLLQGIDESYYLCEPSDEFALLDRDYWDDLVDGNYEIWIKKEDFQVQKVYSFVFPSLTEKGPFSYLLLNEDMNEEEAKGFDAAVDLESAIVSDVEIIDLGD